VEIAGVSAQENGNLAHASIIVYDLSTEVVLQDGEDLEVRGVVKTDWEVYFEVSDTCAGDSLCGLTEYYAMSSDSIDALLKDVTVRYNHDLEGNESMGVNQSLALPNSFMFKFRGYLNNNYRESCTGTQPVYATYFLGTLEQDSCSMEGDYPPCGTVSITEVLDMITKWAANQTDISHVLALITAWAQSG
jgi:hypothetical protein